MKRLIILIATIAYIGSIMAQSPTISHRLPNGVDITLDSTANAIINNGLISSHSNDLITGYTICVYADNGQNARSSANYTLMQLRKMFPGFYTVLRYENPFFKVYIGKCVNRSEAIRLLGVIEPRFPRAIISMEEFSIDVFGEIPAELPDTIATELPTISSSELTSFEQTSIISNEV